MSETTASLPSLFHMKADISPDWDSVRFPLLFTSLTEIASGFLLGTIILFAIFGETFPRRNVLPSEGASGEP